MGYGEGKNGLGFTGDAVQRNLQSSTWIARALPRRRISVLASRPVGVGPHTFFLAGRDPCKFFECAEERVGRLDSTSQLQLPLVGPCRSPNSQNSFRFCLRWSRWCKPCHRYTTRRFHDDHHLGYWTWLADDMLTDLAGDRKSATLLSCVPWPAVTSQRLDRVW